MTQPEIVKPWYNASANDGSSCLDAQHYSDGSVQLRQSKDPDGPRLTLDAAEWSTFLAGVRRGEFNPVV